MVAQKQVDTHTVDLANERFFRRLPVCSCGDPEPHEVHRAPVSPWVQRAQTGTLPVKEYGR